MLMSLKIYLRKILQCHLPYYYLLEKLEKKGKLIGDNYSVEAGTIGGKEHHILRLIDLLIKLDTESLPIRTRS